MVSVQAIWCHALRYHVFATYMMLCCSRLAALQLYGTLSVCVVHATLWYIIVCSRLLASTLGFSRVANHEVYVNRRFALGAGLAVCTDGCDPKLEIADLLICVEMRR